MIFPSSGLHRPSSLSDSNYREVVAGYLHLRDTQQSSANVIRILAREELIIGRDTTKCQVVVDDPFISSKHLRIYTVIYDSDNPGEVDPLVYAEDLSRNGTYWNKSLIGKGNGGYLLSDGDVLRLTSRTSYVFKSGTAADDHLQFDNIQEREMKLFSADYIVTDRLLGSGAFGRVFMAVEQSTRSQLACKVVDLRKIGKSSKSYIGRAERPLPAKDINESLQRLKLKTWSDQKKREIPLEDKLGKYCREVEILASLNHPNIVGLEKVYMTDNTLYMFLDLVTAGDLFSYIEYKNSTVSEVDAANIVRQVLLAVQYLHNNNIVHRDLKPDNILMTSLVSGCRVVVTDFGGARRVNNNHQRMNSVVGSAQYAAPEVLEYFTPSKTSSRPGYTKAVDMWAVGCITVTVLTGGLAFADPVTGCFSERLARDCDMSTLKTSPEWKRIRSKPRAFIQNLVVLNEHARLNADEALSHRWFSDDVYKADFEDLYKRTVRKWHPRLVKRPVVEFFNSTFIKNLACSAGVLGVLEKLSPHISRPFLPMRRRSKELSDEEQIAIKDNWSRRAMLSRRCSINLHSPKESMAQTPSLRRTDSSYSLGVLNSMRTFEQLHRTGPLTTPTRHSFRPHSLRTFTKEKAAPDMPVRDHSPLRTVVPAASTNEKSPSIVLRRSSIHLPQQDQHLESDDDMASQPETHKTPYRPDTISLDCHKDSLNSQTGISYQDAFVPRTPQSRSKLKSRTDLKSPVLGSPDLGPRKRSQGSIFDLGEADMPSPSSDSEHDRGAYHHKRGRFEPHPAETTRIDLD